MEVEKYQSLKQQIIERGFESDIIWAREMQPCSSADDFAREYCFVVCNCGTNARVAQRIFIRCWEALEAGQHPKVAGVFRNLHKSSAMYEAYQRREQLFSRYQHCWTEAKKLAMLMTLPYIGEVTKFHLAKNLGIDCFKPDRHVARIAALYDLPPAEMFARLQAATGDTLNLIYVVMWRASLLRLI